MKFGRKVLTSLCAAALMVSCMAVGAAAATNSKQIQALLDYGITVKYNGQAQQFKDAAGNAVYPITYNGTTYLPVRAVAGLVNLPVDWDGDTRTVLLGEKDKTPVTSARWGYYIGQGVKTSALSKPVIDGRVYDFGLFLTDGGYANFYTHDAGYFDVSGGYNILHVLAYSDSDVTLSFHTAAPDDTVYEEIEIAAGVATPVDIYLAGADEVWVGIAGVGNIIVTLTDIYLK